MSTLLSFRTEYTHNGNRHFSTLTAIAGKASSEPDGRRYQQFAHPVPYSETVRAIGVVGTDQELRLRCQMYDGRVAELHDTVTVASHPQPLSRSGWDDWCKIGEVHVTFRKLRGIPVRVTGWSHDVDCSRALFLGVDTRLRLEDGCPGRVVGVMFARYPTDGNNTFFLLDDGSRVPMD